jgi:hypothetical protein
MQYCPSKSKRNRESRESVPLKPNRIVDCYTHDHQVANQADLVLPPPLITLSLRRKGYKSVDLSVHGHSVGIE